MYYTGKEEYKITTIQSSTLTNFTGKYYVGMTLEDAKAKNLNLKIFNDIDKLDGNADGTLSLKDITEKRDDECNKKTNWGLIGCAAAIGAALIITPIGLIGAGIALICSTSLFMDSESEKKVTQKYK